MFLLSSYPLLPYVARLRCALDERLSLNQRSDRSEERWGCSFISAATYQNTLQGDPKNKMLVRHESRSAWTNQPMAIHGESSLRKPMPSIGTGGSEERASPGGRFHFITCKCLRV